MQHVSPTNPPTIPYQLGILPSKLQPSPAFPAFFVDQTPTDVSQFLWTGRLNSHSRGARPQDNQYQPIPVGSTSMCIYVDGDFISIPLSMIYIYSTVNPRINQTHHQKWLGFKPFPNWSRLFGFPTLLGGFNKPPLPDQRHTPPGKLRVLSTENL